MDQASLGLPTDEKHLLPVSTTTFSALYPGSLGWLKYLTYYFKELNLETASPQIKLQEHACTDLTIEKQGGRSRQ
jgi:hypothetical protein